MIWKDKNGKYRIKFQHQNKTVQKRTKLTSAVEARKVEAKLKVELELGNYNILRPKPVPILSDFLRKDFLPFTESRFANVFNTRHFYSFGAKLLQSSDMAKLKLDEINSQHTVIFAAQNSHLSPSSVNCGLKTLCRCLRLAVQWGKLPKAPRIELLFTEQRRDRAKFSDCAGRTYCSMVKAAGLGLRKARRKQRDGCCLWCRKSTPLCWRDGKRKAGRVKVGYFHRGAASDI